MTKVDRSYFRALAGAVKVDGETYELRRGPVPEDVPSKVLAAFPDSAFGEPSRVAFERAQDMADPTSVGFAGDDPGAEAPNPPAMPEGLGGDVRQQSSGGGGGSGSELPDGAPDASTAEVSELAEFIDENDLNAGQTVALAGGSAEGARRVLEAERVSTGGDGRKTVREPLERLIAEGSGGTGS